MLATLRGAFWSSLILAISVYHAFGHEPERADPRAWGAIMPRISPDGQSIVCSYQGAIWRLARDGSEARRLTGTDSRFDRDPIWSPDGGRIAFARAPSFYSGDLAVIDAQTGATIETPQSIRVQGKIAFDGAGDRVLGVFEPTDKAAALAWFDLKTGELTDALAPGAFPTGLDTAYRPQVFALSRDGKTLAVVTNHDVSGEQSGNQGPRVDVWQISLDAGGTGRESKNGPQKTAAATAKKIVTWPARIHELCWSADNRSLIVATERGGVHTDLWEIPLAEPEIDARKLTFGQADEACPSVDAAGGWLCYTDNRRGATMLIVRDSRDDGEMAVVPKKLDFGVSTGNLEIVVSEPGSSGETTARVSVRHEQGKYHAPLGSLYRLQVPDLNFYIHGETRFEVPAGRYAISVDRGPEYATVVREVSIESGRESVASVELARWTDQRAEGWISGESHIHANYGYGHWYNSPATMRLQCEGENLMVANLMVANSDGDGVFDREFFLGRPDPLSTDKTILYWNEEFRATLWGHMTLLNLKWLVTPIFTGFKETSHPHDFPMNAHIADHVHDQNGFVNYTHPAHSTQDPYSGAYSAKEAPVDVALGKIDSMDVMSNYQANLPLWYRLLNCGFRVPASAGTDCFLNRIPSVLPGASRVYVHCPDDFSYETWIERHREGRTFVSSGPVVRFTVDGHEPGETIQLTAPGKVRIVAEAQAERATRSLELIQNGDAILLASSSAEPPDRKLAVEREIEIKESCWLALRVNGQPGETQNHPFAHTSPVYVMVGDDKIESASDAKYFIAWIERLRDHARRRNQLAPRHVEIVEEELAAALARYRAQVGEGK